MAVEVFENELNVIKKSKQVSVQKIKMKSKYIFNMVNTSLVLGLYPVNEKEYNKLMNLYYLFDDVKKLNYPLTPHITLAYYNVNGFDVDSVDKLKNIVRELNENDSDFEIDLDVRQLFYQKFISMNEYINIINLADSSNA